MLDAAIEVYGEFGFQKATVQAVCDVAGLTKRYFYESFADAPALLAETFRKVSGEFLLELGDAAQTEHATGFPRARLILKAYFLGLRDDPRQARLFLLDTRGVSQEVDTVMASARRALSELLTPPASGAAAEPCRVRLQRLGASAGLLDISTAWIESNFQDDIEDLVEAAAGLFIGIIDAT